MSNSTLMKNAKAVTQALGVVIRKYQLPSEEAHKIFVEEYKKEMESDADCEWCDGTGEVATDESDGEGHIMRGVGTAKCICQKQSQSE